MWNQFEENAIKYGGASVYSFFNCPVHRIEKNPKDERSLSISYPSDLQLVLVQMGLSCWTSAMAYSIISVFFTPRGTSAVSLSTGRRQAVHGWRCWRFCIGLLMFPKWTVSLTGPLTSCFHSISWLHFENMEILAQLIKDCKLHNSETMWFTDCLISQILDHVQFSVSSVRVS